MLRNKKIIIVLGWLGMGGAERQTLHVARHLKHAQNADVEVWAFHTAGEMAKALDAEGIPWRIVSWPWAANHFSRVLALWRFSRELRAAKPDVILPYIMQSSFFCGLIWKLTGAQTCFWNQRDEGRDVHGSRLERVAIHNVSKVLSNSRHAADMLIQLFTLDPERVLVIRNGVQPEPPQFTREQWREKLGLSNNCFAICMVANLHSYKDHDTLLRAWRLVLNQSDKDAQLLLAGVPQDTSEKLHQLTKELELDSHVQFLGGVDDVSGLLGAVDLGVFSSRCEGVPNGVLECMAAGLAVVGTDIPGIREALGEDDAEFLAPEGNAEILAECILRLWTDADLRRDVGMKNRERIASEFSVEKLCHETVRVLEASLQTRR